MIDTAVNELAPVVGVRKACEAVGEAQARWYRRHRQSPPPARPERVARPQPRALSDTERAKVREVLNSAEHVDQAPATVYAELLDQGIYLASVSSIQATEGAKFWAGVCAELANRGVRDVLIVCCDGLTGFPEATAPAPSHRSTPTHRR